MTAAVLTALVLILLAAIVYLLRCNDRLDNQLATERGKTRHLRGLVAGYRTDVSRLSADNGRLIAENADLVDALDAINGDLPSEQQQAMADEWHTFINRWPVLEDPR